MDEILPSCRLTVAAAIQATERLDSLIESIISVTCPGKCNSKQAKTGEVETTINHNGGSGKPARTCYPVVHKQSFDRAM